MNSKLISVIACIACLLAGIALGISLPHAAAAPDDKEVIGVLLPLSGGLSKQGQSTEAALNARVSDINRYLSEFGADRRITLLIRDTGTSAATAREHLNEFQDAGVKVVIGMPSSQTLAGLAGDAEENGMILVSDGSTAPSLARDDAIFRFVPSDLHQAAALSMLIHTDGADDVVMVWRDDIWGNDLSKALREACVAEGMNVSGGVSYDPAHVVDFSTVASLVNAEVGEVRAGSEDTNVAVVVIGYQETFDLLSAASEFAGLGELQWYGSDGSAQNHAALTEPGTIAFMQKTGFSAPAYSVIDQTYYPGLSDAVKTRTGAGPMSQAYVACDALEVVSRALVETGPDADPGSLALAIKNVAGAGYGATGWTGLDGAGDRAVAYYDFWGVGQAGEGYEWKVKARYGTDPLLGTYITGEIAEDGPWYYLFRNNGSESGTADRSRALVNRLAVHLNDGIIVNTLDGTTVNANP